MICPHCQRNGSRVVDSRPSEDGTFIRRRRISANHLTGNFIFAQAPHPGFNIGRNIRQLLHADRPLFGRPHQAV